MRALKLLGFVVVFALTGPLWVVGFVLVWLHKFVNGVALAVIRWGFWEPCQWGWLGMVNAWRAFRAAPPTPGSEAERLAKAENFRRRAAKVGGRR